jgi:DNA-directed RNA polymerase specialized sigma24 family protein
MLECPDPDERVLVALAQSGDRDALEALLRRYYRPLRAFIVPLVGGSHADDVLQDIALATFQNLRYLRHPGAFRSWAYRLASRRAFRHLKRERRWTRMDTDLETLAALPTLEPLPDAQPAPDVGRLLRLRGDTIRHGRRMHPPLESLESQVCVIFAVPDSRAMLCRCGSWSA